MQYVSLGRTGLKVARLCLGTMNFGPHTSEPDSYAIMDKGRRANENVQKQIDKRRPQLEAWERFCAERGQDPADVAIAWLLHNPAVTAPIIGPRTLDQLTGAVRALDIKLDEQAMNRLNEIWPGPGGEAPEAYSW